MKRMLNQALSLISPNRREDRSPTGSETSSTPPTKRARQSSVSDVYAHLDAIERLQTRLLAIDKECSEEQMAVQRKFDTMKDPLISQRREEISKIPMFWATAIGNHPATDTTAFSADRPILAFLESVELEDNLDNNGSYSLKFYFASNPYFPQSEISRTVTISDDQTDEVDSTPISWAPKKKPSHPLSFFAWISSSGNGHWESDFGEILRRDLWQNPYPYYLNLSAHHSKPRVE